MMFSPVLKWEDAQVGDLGFYAGDEAFSKAIERFERGLDPAAPRSPEAPSPVSGQPASRPGTGPAPFSVTEPPNCTDSSTAPRVRASVAKHVSEKVTEPPSVPGSSTAPASAASVSEKNFVPSHVFIVWDRYTVVEAWLAGTRNSAASLGPADKYARAMALGHVKLLRPPGHIDDKRAALHWVVNTYGGKSYGVLVLVGFALQETFHLKDNPGGYWGQVCSQTGWRFLSRHVWQMQNRTPPAAIDQASISAIESVLARVPLRDCEPLNLFVATTAKDPSSLRGDPSLRSG